MAALAWRPWAEAASAQSGATWGAVYNVCIGAGLRLLSQSDRAGSLSAPGRNGGDGVEAGSC